MYLNIYKITVNVMIGEVYIRKDKLISFIRKYVNIESLYLFILLTL